MFDENGELVIEDNDFKLSGYQISLQSLCIWLHIEKIKNSASKQDNLYVINFLHSEDNKIVQKENYTPQYKFSLDKIKSDLIKERNENFDFPDRQ